jgi:hypothetical protein
MLPGSGPSGCSTTIKRKDRPLERLQMIFLYLHRAEVAHCGLARNIMKRPNRRRFDQQPSRFCEKLSYLLVNDKDFKLYIYKTTVADFGVP